MKSLRSVAVDVARIECMIILQQGIAQIHL